MNCIVYTIEEVQMGKNLSECLRILEKNKSHMRTNYHIESLAIFGSVARRQNHRSSDVDILVRFSLLPSFFELAHIENFLRKELRMKIDLIIENGVDKSFLNRISNDLIYV